MMSTLDNEGHSRVNLWMNLRERALAVIRANLLIFAAFVPAVAILFRNDIAKLEEIFSSPLTLTGLGGSLTAVGSAGLTMVLIQFTFRGQVQKTGSDEEVGSQLEKLLELTDYLTISEFLTAISVPLVFLGILRSVVPIPLDNILVVLLFSILGVVSIHSGATLTYSIFSGIALWVKRILSKARSGFSTHDPGTWQSINAAALLVAILIAVVNVIYMSPILELQTTTKFLQLVIDGVNIILSVATWAVLTGVLFLIYAILLNAVDWLGIVEIPSDAYR